MVLMLIMATPNPSICELGSEPPSSAMMAG